MSTEEQKEKIKLFREQLGSGKTFIMPEAWDVASARVLGELDFPVIGTSAASIAWVNGYTTNEYIKLEDLLMVAARIARRASQPIQADLVGGLGRSVEHLQKAVQATVAVGCSGIMMSDASKNGEANIMPINEMAMRIKAARIIADQTGIPLVITASTDTFKFDGKGHSPLKDVSERASAYFEAGADCIHVAGIQHVHVVENVAQNIPGPASVRISIATRTNMNEFKETGISCINVGSSLLRSLLGNLRLKADELLTFGQFDHLDRAISVEDLEDLVSYRKTSEKKKPKPQHVVEQVEEAKSDEPAPEEPKPQEEKTPEITLDEVKPESLAEKLDVAEETPENIAAPEVQPLELDDALILEQKQQA